METEYPLVTLGEIAAVRSGFAFKSRDWTDAGVPVVKIANVKGGRLEMDGCSYVSLDVAADASDAQLNIGDILISMTGYIGEVAIVGPRDLPAVLNQRVGRFLITQPSRLDPGYLFYVLRAHSVQNEIERLGYGSAQPNVSPSSIQGIKIPLPSLLQQRAIASILGMLDDKVELNRTMSATLETTARALFKSWFVDLDPVHAKAEGRDTGLTSDISAFFPDEFDRKHETLVPRGWKRQSLDDIATFLNGLALQKFPARDGKATFPIIKIAQLRAGNAVGADRAGAGIPSDYVIENGDILFSWSGSLECEIWVGGSGALNQHLFKVRGTTVPDWFAYLSVKQHLPEFRHIAAGKATTMGHIQRYHLHEATIAVPPKPLLQIASAVIGPLVESSWHRRLESVTLAVIRDILLPKLLSGEVQIPCNPE